MTDLSLKLKPTTTIIKTFYADIAQNIQLGFTHEGAMKNPFGRVLDYCAKQSGLFFSEEYRITLGNGRDIRLDGAVLRAKGLRMGAWEAKDTQDDLDKEIQKKFAGGYPKDNILFQSPDRAVLYQNGRLVLDVPIDKGNVHHLIHILTLFFGYTNPQHEAWEHAVAEFKPRLPEIASGLNTIIEEAYKTNGKYKTAFDNFHDLCRAAINPNLSKDAVEEMLIQHILTERIFRRVFKNDKFTSENIIAKEIERVIQALISKSFSREDFLQKLDHFYIAIENTAGTIEDYSEKQDFLNTVYEQFFQGFSVAVADTHGIVYTPQPIVQFMVRSVEQLLKDQFGRSLADEGVHILDPFVGTGNFMLRVMEEIRATKRSALAHKYAHELHCNEVMLLPYYIASMNIEHAYYEAMGEYAPFEGICLVDTFELAEGRQTALSFFTPENLARVERQQKSPLTVILGNPPYNAWQVNENDNNKNRKYKVIDGRVKETYARASSATLKNALSDPYVKAFRWASDRLKDEGIIAFVTNNGFLDNIAFDGMRKHLGWDFDAIYVLDLGGNVRKNPKLSGTTHNVFGIQVGVCITFLIRKKENGQARKGQIFYARMDEWWRRGQKYDELARLEKVANVAWQPITPTQKHLWLSEGMVDEFETFMPMGTKEAKRGKGQAIFEVFSLGIATNRDNVVYGYRKDDLLEQTKIMADAYNIEVDRYNRAGRPKDVDEFVKYDSIKWSNGLKNQLKRGHYIDLNSSNIRVALYRPFTKRYLMFNSRIIEAPSQFPRIFPNTISENENRIIILTNLGSEKPFMTLISKSLTDYHMVGAGSGTQCFPLYVYDEDGGNRRENISDWALGEYRRAYQDESISKADIFYSIYALLHHPQYRERYAQNLKRELPRVPIIKMPHALTEGNMPHPLTEGNMPHALTEGNAPHPLTPSPLRGEGESENEDEGFSPFLHEMGKGGRGDRGGFGDSSRGDGGSFEGRGDRGDSNAFHTLAKLGRELSSVHLNYEQEAEYPLEEIENPKTPPNYRVEAMRLSKDKSELVLNNFLTLRGIPPRVYEYKLGNRSALEWVIDQYRVSEDKRSGIINDPNRLDDEQYIVRLIKQVVQVSLETLRIVDEIGRFVW